MHNTDLSHKRCSELMSEQSHHEKQNGELSFHLSSDTKVVANKKRFRRFWPMKRRIKVLHQMSMAECGAASLAMILTYYGRKTSVSEIRDHCGVGRDGLSARVIAQAARAYGLRVRALSLPENDFRFVQLPAIIHWEFHHFLIVEKWAHKYVDLVDPAFGRRRISAEEFDNGFTGIVLTFEPGVNFERRTTTGRVSLMTYALNYARIAPVRSEERRVGKESRSRWWPHH